MAGKQKIYKGILTFGDKQYDCEVRDGVQYINGKTIDQFLDTLSDEDLQFLSRIGNQLLTGKKVVKN